MISGKELESKADKGAKIDDEIADMTASIDQLIKQAESHDRLNDLHKQMNLGNPFHPMGGQHLSPREELIQAIKSQTRTTRLDGSFNNIQSSNTHTNRIKEAKKTKDTTELRI